MSIFSRKLQKATSKHPSSPPSDPMPTSSYWSMGYFPGYKGTRFSANDVEWGGLTHAMVFALRPTAAGGLDEMFWYNTATEGNAWADGMRQKAQSAGKKAFITLGGAGTYDNFTSSLSTAANRTSLITSLLTYIDNHHYDGFDMDYEPLSDSDAPNAILFLQELKTKRPSLIISFCSGQYNSNRESLYMSKTNLFEISKYIDMFNLMTYGMAYAFSGWQSWHSSPLYGHGSTTPMSIDFDVSVCLSAGIAAKKIGIGLGCYAEPYVGCTGPKQDFTSKGEHFAYSELVSGYLPNMTSVWDETAKVPYLWSNSAVGSDPQATYISYDNEQSIKEKTNYIKSKGIGGVILWEISQQYIASAAQGSRYPYLNVLENNLLN